MMSTTTISTVPYARRTSCITTCGSGMRRKNTITPLICKNVADHHYEEAIQLTNLLTNSTDQYKFQTEIYELAGDTAKAFIAQKHYTAVKDSVNNVIMGEEMVGSASDLVSCNELAKQVGDAFKGNEQQNVIRFTSSLKDHFKIKTNSKEAEKILNNLMSNACKFTEQGTITLSCYQDQLENDFVCFSVTDTGKGVKDGEEDKIFEHFYKVDAYKEGVGLGLPLARRIARQMGGDVILDTSYKEGSRFILKLPVA